jgi:hypothetical protein
MLRLKLFFRKSHLERERRVAIPTKNESQLFQVLQDIENYLKSHIGDIDPIFFREKLRFLHRILTNGQPKSCVRGILTFYTRWARMKILNKTIDVINYLTKNKLNRDNLISKPYICKEKILSTIDILPFRAVKIKMLEIKQE